VRRGGWFDWRGLIALVLAAGLVAALIIAELLTARNPARESGLTAEEATTASTIFGALVGAVAVYLGGTVREPREPGRHRDDGPPPTRDPVGGGPPGPP
jgi:hypothetical protein